MEKKKYFFALILIFIVGGLDAYCYLLHDGMFAAMQTGNMIQIAIKLSRGDFGGIGKHFITIFAFVFGILAQFFISKKVKKHEVVSIITAFVCYCAGLLIPLGELNFLSNLIIAFGVGVQLQVIKSINGFGVATTMCTGNLRSFSECLCGLMSTKDKKYALGMLIYSTLIISFMIGVFAVGLIIRSVL